MTYLTPYRGFALPTLMMILALISIGMSLASRTLWMNEKMLNAEADQLRNQHKANALLPQVLADITGTSLNNEGTPNLRHTMGDAMQTHAFFPTSIAEYEVLRKRLGSTSCSMGICAPNTLDASAAQARYWKNQVTTAMPVNTLDIPEGEGTAWYWVEVFPQTSIPTFIYRITIFSKGIMPSGNTVLQAIWKRDGLTTHTGHWQSWHVLHD